jgi:hypothetical protein
MRDNEYDKEINLMHRVLDRASIHPREEALVLSGICEAQANRFIETRNSRYATESLRYMELANDRHTAASLVYGKHEEFSLRIDRLGVNLGYAGITDHFYLAGLNTEAKMEEDILGLMRRAEDIGSARFALQMASQLKKLHKAKKT